MAEYIRKTYFIPIESELTAKKVEEMVEYYVDDVDDRTKAELVKALVELHKANLDASDKSEGRRNELIKYILDFTAGLIKASICYVLMGHCLSFETTGGFTSPISKIFLNKISNVF